MNKNKWVYLTNLYCPPVSSEHPVKFDPSAVRILPNSIICGDLNAHSELWDQHAKPCDRVEEIEDWAVSNDLSIINDGSYTRTDRSDSNKKSSPDITLSGIEYAGKIDWRVGDPIGKSHNFPITSTIHLKVTHQIIIGTSARWKSKRVDWTKFRDQTEKQFAKLKPTKNLKILIENLVNILYQE